MAKRRPSDLHVGLLCVHQLLDDFAQPLSGAHVPVTRPEQGGLSAGDPLPACRTFLCPVHQTPGGKTRPLLEGLVQGAHGVHTLETENRGEDFFNICQNKNKNKNKKKGGGGGQRMNLRPSSQFHCWINEGVYNSPVHGLDVEPSDSPWCTGSNLQI